MVRSYRGQCDAVRTDLAYDLVVGVHLPAKPCSAVSSRLDILQAWTYHASGGSVPRFPGSSQVRCTFPRSVTARGPVRVYGSSTERGRERLPTVCSRPPSWGSSKTLLRAKGETVVIVCEWICFRGRARWRGEASVDFGGSSQELPHNRVLTVGTFRHFLLRVLRSTAGALRVVHSS